jgi:hypothetical protein
MAQTREPFYGWQDDQMVAEQTAYQRIQRIMDANAKQKEWADKGARQGAAHAIGTIRRMYGEGGPFPIHTAKDIDIRACEQRKGYTTAPPIFHDHFITAFKQAWHAEYDARIMASLKDMARLAGTTERIKFKRIARS